MVVGRPRTFDIDKALDRALMVFWRKGYEGTSLADLTNAMGINRPSLYAAFGNKEDLFRRVLDYYSQRHMAFIGDALNQPTAWSVADHLLNGAADMLSDPGTPPGCLMVQGALSCGDNADCIRREMITRRAVGEAAIRERLERARSEGDLPANAYPADLALYLMTVIHGMSVQAASGATHDELRRIVKAAMRSWPKQGSVYQKNGYR
ncbi:MAG TPA: TetR/AcrR family transcriptional regulator [Blastocatellia bacterium]|nr:TetR/AcrR family transcriptional regulator [Blastocatellia bacterium]